MIDCNTEASRTGYVSNSRTNAIFKMYKMSGYKIQNRKGDLVLYGVTSLSFVEVNICFKFLDFDTSGP